MFAKLYECPNCGPVWQVSRAAMFDPVKDESYTNIYCDHCLSMSLKEKKSEDGTPQMHPLTREEILAQSEHYDPWEHYDDDYFDEWDYE